MFDYDIINCVAFEKKQHRVIKKLWKKLKKVVDKFFEIWYITYASWLMQKWSLKTEQNVNFL